MFDNIKFGNYVVGDSLIHRLSPILKIISVLLMVISLFFVGTYNDILILGVYLLLVLVYSDIDIRLYLKSLYTIRIFLLFILIIDLIFTPYLDRIIIDLFKLIFIVMYASVLTFTTPMTEITYGIERILRVFNKYIPSNDIAMVLTLTLRYIPTLISEYNRIILAQKLRGVDFKDRNIKNRIKNIVSVLTPMFILSIKKASTTADIMDLRLYNYGKSRTNYRYNKWKIRDSFILVLNVLILVIVIFY